MNTTEMEDASEATANLSTTGAPEDDAERTIPILPALPPIFFAVYVFWGLSLLGIVLNSLSVKILQQFPDSSFYFYLKCLSACDLAFDICILLGCIKNTAIVLMKYYWFAFIFAYIQPYLLYSLAASTTWITVWMSVERFFVIQFPLKTINWFSRRTARIALAVIVIFSFVFNIRYFFITTLVRFYNRDTGALYFTARSAWYSTPVSTQWIFIGTIINQWVPAILLLVCNCAIIVSLVSASIKRQQMQNQSTESDFSKELKITIVLLCIVLLFLVLEAPVGIPYIVGMSLNTRLAFQITYIINHTINFFTYMVSNKEFRSHAWALLKQTATGKAPEPSKMTSATNAGYSSRASFKRDSSKKMATVAQIMKSNLAEKAV